jgi:hypothetical protein
VISKRELIAGNISQTFTSSKLEAIKLKVANTTAFIGVERVSVENPLYYRKKRDTLLITYLAL